MESLDNVRIVAFTPKDRREFVEWAEYADDQDLRYLAEFLRTIVERIDRTR